MSLKIKINEEDLKKIKPEQLITIFNNNIGYFAKEKYLLERYNREQEIQQMINEKDDTKIKVIVNMEGQLVDTATGYGANKPITYYDKSDSNYVVKSRKSITGKENSYVEKVKENERNEYLDKLIEIYKENDCYLIDNDEMKSCLIHATSDEMVFIDSNTGEIIIRQIYDDCITFYDNSILDNKIGFARMIQYNNPITNAIEKSYELYTNEKQIKFNESDKNPIPLEYGGLTENPIPFVRYDIGKSLIESLISEIRSYELVTNNMKKILNYNDESILIVPDYMINNEEENQQDGVSTTNPYIKAEETIKSIKTNGVLFVDSDSENSQGIRWLIKDVNDSANENHKKNLKDDIYNVAGTYNPSSDNMVYQNTLSLMFKLYGLETKMGRYCQVMRKGKLERIYLITNLLNTQQSTNYDYKNIDMTFSRDLPSNMNEQINFANQLKDIVSRETIYELLDFIENPTKELEKWKAWELEVARLEAEKSKIIAQATQEDMKPDRVIEKNVVEQDVVEEV